MDSVDIRAEDAKFRKGVDIHRTWPTVNCGRASHVCLSKGWVGDSIRTEKRWVMCYRTGSSGISPICHSYRKSEICEMCLIKKCLRYFVMSAATILRNQKCFQISLRYLQII